MKKVVLFYSLAAFALVLLAALAFYLLLSHVGFYWKYKKEKPASAEQSVPFPHPRSHEIVIEEIDDDYFKTGSRVATVSYLNDNQEVEFMAHLPAGEFKIGEHVFIIGVETFGPAEEQSGTMYFVRRK